MDTFSYFFVLVSIVVGLALTHILRGIGQRIQHPGRFDMYWVHLVWAAYVFEYVLAFWWFEYGYTLIGEWTFELYLFVVGYAIVLYLLSVILFPDDLGEYSGFREYFYARRHWFFGLLAFAQVVDFADTFAKGTAHAGSMGVEYWFYNGGTVLLALVAARTRSSRFHGAFAALALLAQSAFILDNYILS